MRDLNTQEIQTISGGYIHPRLLSNPTFVIVSGTTLGALMVTSVLLVDQLIKYTSKAFDTCKN